MYQHYIRAPEWDVSATAEAKYDPFGEPSRKGTRKPWPNFCQAFRVLLRGGGALAKFSASPFCEINKKLVWRLGVDGIHWLQGLRGVGPTPLQATFRNTSP